MFNSVKSLELRPFWVQTYDAWNISLSLWCFIYYFHSWSYLIAVNHGYGRFLEIPNPHTRAAIARKGIAWKLMVGWLVDTVVIFSRSCMNHSYLFNILIITIVILYTIFDVHCLCIVWNCIFEISLLNTTCCIPCSFNIV